MLGEQKNFFYVLTGGPGVGKTTLLKELSKNRFQIVSEDARKIIQEQVKANGEALPWRNKLLYARLMFDASVTTYQKITTENVRKAIFFDRGIPDAICYMNMESIPVSSEMIEIVNENQYNKNVFILPPWKEIYVTDSERKQTWENALYTFHKMKEVYLEYGYNVIEVPKESVESRVQFIIDQIQSSKSLLNV